MAWIERSARNRKVNGERLDARLNMPQWRARGAALWFAMAIAAVAGTNLNIRDALVSVAAAQDSLGQFFASQGHCHIGESCPPRGDNYELYPYNSDPPTSGPHEERFPTTFISDTALPKRILVHILEHGNVEILYNKDASPDLIKELRDYAMQYDFRFWMLQTPQSPGADVGEQLEAAQAVFVAPYPNMTHKIALAAWTRLDAFGAYDQGRINRFVKAWVGNAQNAHQ